MKILLWGDALGVAEAVEVIGSRSIAGVVAAANRAADWAALVQLARAYGVPCLIQPFRRDAAGCRDFTKGLQRLAADLFLVSSYSMILPHEWLTMPALGTVNVHCALLPQYRGANVLNWVLVNGETETGATIHYIDDGIDTGDIILQRRLAINFDDTALSLRTKLCDLWPTMLAEVIGMLEKGNCPRQAQDETKARHWPRRRPEEGRIDWRWPAERIYDLIRALVKPWPGAFFETVGRERVTLDAFVPLAQVLQMQNQYAGEPARISA